MDEMKTRENDFEQDDMDGQADHVTPDDVQEMKEAYADAMSVGRGAVNGKHVKKKGRNEK